MIRKCWSRVDAAPGWIPLKWFYPSEGEEVMAWSKDTQRQYHCVYKDGTFKCYGEEHFQPPNVTYWHYTKTRPINA